VLSNDGRFVAFDSAASDLVAGDSDMLSDTFVLDRLTNTLELVSTWGAGATTNSPWTRVGGISDDGNWVVFLASGLNPADLDDTADVCLRDRASGVTMELSPNSNVQNVFQISRPPQISADGRYIAFEESEAAWATRAFVWDRNAGAIVWARTGTMSYGSSRSLHSRAPRSFAAVERATSVHASPRTRQTRSSKPPRASRPTMACSQPSHAAARSVADGFASPRGCECQAPTTSSPRRSASSANARWSSG